MEFVEIPQMILIGSTGRNSGKTTAAVKLIEHLKEKVNVIGLKVTSINEKDGKCPRGGEGCGVCSSLKGNFQILEEKVLGDKKDTSILLSAGASNVYWIKTLKRHSLEAITQFMGKVPRESIIICESNSLRKVVKPGVFVMLKKRESDVMKVSAKEVIDKADIITNLDDINSNEFLTSIMAYIPIK